MYEIISWVLLVASLFELHEGQLKLFAISIALSGLFGLVAGLFSIANSITSTIEIKIKDKEKNTK